MKARTTRDAFTLIEVLAVIAIVAVLLAILLPALSGARESAKLNTHRANMRECLNTITLYSQSFGDSFPFMGVVGHPELGVEEFDDFIPQVQGMSYNAAYFSANSFHWPTAVQRAGFDIAATAEPDPERRQYMLDRYHNPELLGSAYQLTHATVATPDYWNTGPAPFFEPHYFKPMRTHQVRYPSSKGLLLALRLGFYDATDDEEKDWVLVGLGDNSVSKKTYPGENGIEYRPYSCLPFPIMTTVDGLEGRDF